MTDYNRLTDAQTEAEYFFTQDDMRQLRDNQDSFNERILQLLAQSKNAIVDDFFSGDGGRSGESSYDDSMYERVGSAGQSLGMVPSTGDHVHQMTTINSASTAGLIVKSQKLLVRLNQDMACFMESRVKDVGGAAPQNLMFGLTNNPGSVTNEGDLIAFVKGTTAGKWRFRVASGGVPTETDNVGNRATWQKLRFEFLRSGGGTTLQVQGFIDGSAVAAPVTTNIPVGVHLHLVALALGPASGTMDARLDRWETRWAAVPLNS